MSGHQTIAIVVQSLLIPSAGYDDAVLYAEPSADDEQFGCVIGPFTEILLAGIPSSLIDAAMYIHDRIRPPAFVTLDHDHHGDAVSVNFYDPTEVQMP